MVRNIESGPKVVRKWSENGPKGGANIESGPKVVRENFCMGGSPESELLPRRLPTSGIAAWERPHESYKKFRGMNLGVCANP